DSHSSVGLSDLRIHGRDDHSHSSNICFPWAHRSAESRKVCCCEAVADQIWLLGDCCSLIQHERSVATVWNSSRLHYVDSERSRYRNVFTREIERPSSGIWACC